MECSLCNTSLRVRRGVRFPIREYLKHLQLFHAHQPNFKVTCGIGGCPRTYTNIKTYSNHVYSVHDLSTTSSSEPIPSAGSCNHDSTPSCNVDGGSLDPTECSTEDESIPDNDYVIENHENIASQPPDYLQLQKSSALLLLGLKEKYKLPQSTVQGIVHGITSLLQQQMDTLKSQVFDKLTAADVNVSHINGLEECFVNNSNPFNGLDSPYQQRKYFAANFNLIEPTSVLLGERKKWKGSGAKRKCVLKKDHLYYVPILRTLESLLNNSKFLSEVEQGHKSLLDIMEDYCDGEAFKSHALFSVQTTAIQILFYFDELEVCCPIGTKAKIHKLGAFYFTIGNLPPKYRSRLSSIHLVALVKSTFIGNYGMDSVLKPFISDVKKLEEGVEMMIFGQTKTIYGTIAVVSADNLGSLALGGFKESCSAARMCRHCMTTKEDSQTKFIDNQFVARDKVSHKLHCSLIAEDSSGKASMNYGVNRDSILNQLTYFHVCDGSLLPDVMHDLLKGALQYEVKLLLHYMIENCGLSLQEFNSRLENVDLGYMEFKNKPTLVSGRTITSDGNSLKQNASQMWLLARILPLLVGDFVDEDDKHWQLYLQLMDIVDLIFCPKTSHDHASYVASLISDHHSVFCELYSGKTIIPKMHFMVHMPKLMIKYGPLVRHWTMRFEAKHSYFKQLAHSLGNFINLPYSLASRHQQYQCYLNAVDLPDSVDSLEVGPGTTISVEELEEIAGNKISTAFQTRWVKTNGHEYKKDAGIIYEVEHDLPIVGKIQDIYIIDGSKVLFNVKPYLTHYHPHFRSYLLHERTESDVQNIFLYVSNLFIDTPVHIRRSQVLGTEIFILLPYALCTL